jgi:hypothetical protein
MNTEKRQRALLRAIIGLLVVGLSPILVMFLPDVLDGSAHTSMISIVIYKLYTATGISPVILTPFICIAVPGFMVALVILLIKRSHLRAKEEERGTGQQPTPPYSVNRDGSPRG